MVRDARGLCTETLDDQCCFVVVAFLLHCMTTNYCYWDIWPVVTRRTSTCFQVDVFMKDGFGQYCVFRVCRFQIPHSPMILGMYPGLCHRPSSIA